jgi:hypothetical protein
MEKKKKNNLVFQKIKSPTISQTTKKVVFQRKSYDVGLVNQLQLELKEKEEMLEKQIRSGNLCLKQLRVLQEKNKNLLKEQEDKANGGEHDYNKMKERINELEIENKKLNEKLKRSVEEGENATIEDDDKKEEVKEMCSKCKMCRECKKKRKKDTTSRSPSPSREQNSSRRRSSKKLDAYANEGGLIKLSGFKPPKGYTYIGSCFF